MMSLTLFGILSVLLLKQSYEDWKTKLVDVPIALFATGFVAAAYLFSQRYWEFLFWGLFFLIGWRILKPYCEKNNLIGAGDISVLTFLMPAAWFVNLYSLTVFLAVFGIAILVFYRKQLMDKTDKPLIPVITIAWVFTWIISQTWLVLA